MTVYRFAGEGFLPHGYSASSNRANDIVAVVPKEAAAPEPLSWNTVRIVGELRPRTGTLNADVDCTMLQLAERISCFSGQPNRHWTHGFTPCGPEFRVWCFDCGGACGSTLIDVGARSDLLLRAMVAYLEMGATEVFDLTIRWPPRYDGPEMSFGPTTYRITGYPPLPFIHVPTTAKGGGHRYVALPLCVPAIFTPGAVH